MSSQSVGEYQKHVGKRGIVINPHNQPGRKKALGHRYDPNTISANKYLSKSSIRGGMKTLYILDHTILKK